MSKRKTKTIIADDKVEQLDTKVEVVIDTADVEWFDTHLLIPALAFGTMALFLAYMNPAMYTYAYWQHVVATTPAFNWEDFYPF